MSIKIFPSFIASPFVIQQSSKHPFVTTSINISKRDLCPLKKREKKKKESKRKIKARG
jgi:hypothetical protein